MNLEDRKTPVERYVARQRLIIWTVVIVALVLVLL